MGQHFYMSRDAVLVRMSANFAAQISAAAPAFGLSMGQAAAYAAANDAYAAAYQVAVDPGTRSRPRVVAKNEARRALTEMAAELVRIIDAAPPVLADRVRSGAQPVRPGPGRPERAA